MLILFSLQRKNSLGVFFFRHIRWKNGASSYIWFLGTKHIEKLVLFFPSQGLFGKSLDSPAAADADASDTQSVDSGLSRQDSSTGKRDTVCQVSAAHDSSLFHCLPKAYKYWIICCSVHLCVDLWGVWRGFGGVWRWLQPTVSSGVSWSDVPTWGQIHLSGV